MVPSAAIKSLLTILADFADKFWLVDSLFGSLEDCRPSQDGSLTSSQHFIPLALIFEHDLAEEPNRWHAVVEQLVVELLQ